MKKISIEKNKLAFKNLKLKTKLAGVYIIAGLLPILIIVLVTYSQMKSILREKEVEAINSYLYQASAAMENKIEIYNNLANYISYSQTLSQVLSYEYESIYEMYDQYISIMDPMLSSLLYFHDEVKTVTVFSNNGLVKHGDTLAPLSEIEDRQWFDDILQDNEIHWYIDKEQEIAFSASKMSLLERNGMTGVLYISIDYNSVFESFEQTILNNYGIIILNDAGEKIYEKIRFEDVNIEYELNFEEFLERNQEKDSLWKEEYKIISVDSETTGWKVFLYKPENLMISSMQPIIKIALFAAVVCSVATISGIWILSAFVTKRISSLRHSMKEVETGNFSIVMPADSQDEIGDLVRGFNKMNRKLNTLITEVYDGKLKEKEYEMKALRAQISPHFLYNTLSMINL